MKMLRSVWFSGACVLLIGVGAVRAETTVEVKGVHMCCPACVAAVEKILVGIEGVKAECEQRSRTVTIVATDEKVARKALDALAAGGFHGDTGNKDLTIKLDTEVPRGRVKSMTLTGAHNCCGGCTKKIKATLKKVPGVSGDTVKAKSKSFEVTGDFDAGEVVKALCAAGFHVKVKEVMTTKE